LTHGEEWFYRKQHSTVKARSLPNRMGYAEAIEYYSNKIRNFFDEQLTVKDFDNVDDYFGFFEAKKILKQLRIRG